jgi:hypothetical protein
MTASNTATLSIICAVGMGGAAGPSTAPAKASSSSRRESTGGDVSRRVRSPDATTWRRVPSTAARGDHRATAMTSIC